MRTSANTQHECNRATMDIAARGRRRTALIKHNKSESHHNHYHSQLAAVTADTRAPSRGGAVALRLSPEGMATTAGATATPRLGHGGRPTSHHHYWSPWRPASHHRNQSPWRRLSAGTTYSYSSNLFKDFASRRYRPFRAFICSHIVIGYH